MSNSHVSTKTAPRAWESALAMGLAAYSILHVDPTRRSYPLARGAYPP
jgi:hypothetical protein